MLRILDNLYFRFRNAWTVLKDPDALRTEYADGLMDGAEVGKAQIWRQLEKHDPYQFQNGHFKMGYYYAMDQVRKVMPRDEDNSVDAA